MAKDAYYFSHDANAKDDPKCVMLIEQLGLEGFGIYWVLIEVLRDQPTYKYPLALIPAIARRYNTTAEKMKIVVSGYGLFEVDENEFFSLSLIKRMSRMDKLRNQRVEAGKKSAEKRLLLNGCSTSVERALNEIPTDVQQRKEKKGKEIKLKDTKEYVADFTTNVDLLNAIKSFIEMRKSIKAPMTDNAVKLMLNKLNKLSNDDTVKIEILNQSVMSSWKDIYELKQQKLFGNQQQTRREEYPEI
ncbi:MAG: hypothetical protein H6Q69_3358 [Firmicutes bacterium]|nr:hypothetical protein [Bacillota bacterium]